VSGVVTHFQVRWHHDDLEDSVRIYEDLSDERHELREAEGFADGRLIRSDRIYPDFATSLSWELVPPEAEIAPRENSRSNR
jgi:hypothetical protein